MAVSGGYYKQNFYYTPITDQARQGQTADTSGQNGLSGVSDATRQQQDKVQDFTPSDNTIKAQQNLANIQSQKPGEYKSRYTDELDNILGQIVNPQEFKYNFNDDELFKYYADLYTQKGQQASQDAIAQAAALTGGYGNSYAQSVGNQAYQQYLLNLYDKGMDLRDRAYQQYTDDRANNYNIYNTLNSADATDYGRYRDLVGDWQTDRDYYTTAEETAYNRDYTDFVNDRNYWQNQAAAENADYWTAMNFDETQRQNDASRQLEIDKANATNQYNYDSLAENQNQFSANFLENQRQFDETSRYDWATLEENQRQYNATLSEEQRQYDQNLAVDYVTAILANGQIPSDELLVAAGLSYDDATLLKAEAATATTGTTTGTTSGTSGRTSSGTTGDASGETTGGIATGTPGGTTSGTGYNGSGKKMNDISFYDANLIDNADKVAQAATGYNTMDEALYAQALEEVKAGIESGDNSYVSQVNPLAGSLADAAGITLYGPETLKEEVAKKYGYK